ncbi:MAG: GNAT family N-acetyltransferase [Hyphomonas sp.]
MITTPPILKTERLILRGFEANDFQSVANMWADEDVVRFIGFSRTPQDAWFASIRVRGMWPVLGFGYWIVTERETGAFLGETGFADFKRGMTPDLSIHPEAGWAFAKAAWGKGYATEAVTATHKWLDANLPGPSQCIMDPEHNGSRRVAEKVGYTFMSESLYGDNPVNIMHREPQPS